MVILTTYKGGLYTLKVRHLAHGHGRMLKLFSVEEVRNTLAHIKSAIKRIETSAQKRSRNRAMKSTLRTAVKKATLSLTPEDVKRATSLADKTAAKGAIHKNAAARLKSRLARAVQTAQPE